MHQFHKFILSWNSTCFGQLVCPSSGVYSHYTQQWYMLYRFVDSFRAGPGWNSVPSWSCSKAVWHIPLLSVQWINSWSRTVELISCFHLLLLLLLFLLLLLLPCIFFLKSITFIVLNSSHQTHTPQVQISRCQTPTTPWGWIPKDPKHVGVFNFLLKYWYM